MDRVEQRYSLCDNKVSEFIVKGIELSGFRAFTIGQYEIKYVNYAISDGKEAKRKVCNCS